MCCRQGEKWDLSWGKRRFLIDARRSMTALWSRELQCKGMKKQGSLVRSYLGVKEEEEQRWASWNQCGLVRTSQGAGRRPAWLELCDQGGEYRRENPGSTTGAWQDIATTGFCFRCEGRPWSVWAEQLEAGSNSIGLAGRGENFLQEWLWEASCNSQSESW